jgi:hypothetical protein
MIFEDRSSGLTLNLPFDAQSHQLAHLVEFLESSVSDLCDEYRWDGTPCFAFRFGTDVEIALQVIRRVLTEVYGYTEPNNFKCEVHDAGVIE